MVTFLLTSVLIIALLAIALYFWQKPKQVYGERSLPPSPPPRSLFNESAGNQIAPPADPAAQRAGIIERAKNNEQGALLEAHALLDRELYDEALNLMVANAGSDSSLLSLASYVTRNELPVSNSLAQAMLDSWKQAPDRSSTAKALHFAALSDDAALYQNAVEAALRFWREGPLADSSPTELKALFDGEFWILSSRARSSGAGFVLKRALASARRELEAASAKQ